MILRNLSIAWCLSLSFSLLGMREEIIRPYDSFFHAFKASVEQNTERQTTSERSFPIIRGDVEFEIKLLCSTAIHDSDEGLKHFLSCNMDPNILHPFSGENVLHCATRLARKNIISILLQNRNVAPNKRNDVGSTPLQISLLGQFAEITAMLLKHPDINPNIRDQRGNSPLHIAIHWYDTIYTKMLLNHKDTDPNQINEASQTPLNVCCLLGREDQINLLLQDKRIDLDRISLYYGCEYTALTYLMHLSYKYFRKRIQLLLNNGADPNIVTKDYMFGPQSVKDPCATHLAINETTALLQATRYGDAEIVKALILAKADIKVKKEFLMAQEGDTEATIKIFTPYELSLFMQDHPCYAERKQEQIEITQVLAQTDVLREQARTKKLGSGSLFKGLMYKEMGINRRFHK